MSPLRMIMSDKGSRNRHRLVNASRKTGDASSNKPIPYAHSTTAYCQLTKNADFAGSSANTIFTQPMFFSPLHTPQNWQIASRRKEVYQWSRFYFENEPKVAAGVEFYATFPMNGFKLQCKNKKVLEFYESLVDRLELTEWLNFISHEYFLFGDVFPFLQIDCPHCGGSGFAKKDGKMVNCNHQDGTFKSIVILNPEYVNVHHNIMAGDPVYTLTPDEELRQIVQKKEKPLYDKLSDQMIALISAGQPIPLHNHCISHIRFNPSPYGTYGTSMLRRLFTVLAYKTKLMTANWIVAERMILPIRVVKVGDKERPATDNDLADIANQLAQAANDPNLTVVTHNAFDMEWYGACHDKLTEILTNTGFKLFSDLKPEDLVASYNKENGFISFTKPEDYHQYDFSGNLITFKSKSVDIAVTPNHKMLVERQGKLIVIESKDVIHNDKFVSTARWEGCLPAQLPYEQSPLSHLSLYEFLKLVGYYISEGGCKKEKSRIQACGITQKTDSIHYNDIRDICFKTNNNVWIHKDHRSNVPIHTFMFNSKIARYLAEEFGDCSENKKIPAWIKNLPVEFLSVMYTSMMNGDGHSRTSSKGNKRYKYTTTSNKLSMDFSEVLLKLGYFTNSHLEKASNENCHDIYRINFSEKRKKNKFTIRRRNISEQSYNDKVYCVTVDTGFIITRRNGKITIQGNSGKIHNITQELEQIGKEILDGLMINQALLNGEAAAYQSAQVGVEILLRRLENWRNRLKHWVEKKIFLPVAKMQGFIDEEKTKDPEHPFYLYPTLKFNELEIRDKTNKIQILMQGHDKELISSQTVVEEMGYDYDDQLEKIREEKLLATQSGMVMGQGQQGGAGGSPLIPGGGAWGAPPGGDMGGMGGMGGDMGGGMGGAPGGDMGGGMGGAPGGATGGAPGAAAASFQPLKIKKGGQPKKDEEPPPPRVIKLTGLERKMYKILSPMNVPYKLFVQYMVKVPGAERPFMLDFAYPNIGVGIETDGAIWHERQDFKLRDMQRDQKLSQVGWRILRFNEDAVTDKADMVQDVIYKNIVEATESIEKRKSAETEEELMKFSSIISLEDNELKYTEEELPNNMGKIILIGK